MSRTDLYATTLANSLRAMAGDGSMEWVYEPIQASVLLDIADMLDERDELYAELGSAQLNCDMWHDRAGDMRNRLSAKQAENAKLRELVADMLHDVMENVCFKAYWCDEKNWQTCNDKSCGNHLYVDMARELGIEVGK